jgi:hypothetical protein
MARASRYYSNIQPDSLAVCPGPDEHYRWLGSPPLAGPERSFVIVTVYIDESGTHGSGVTIMGGWVGRLGQWAKFDPKWRRLLKDNNLTYFHSRMFRHSKGEFKGWKPEQKNNFVDKAKRASLKNLEFGFVISLPDSAAGYRPREVPLDSSYGLCFRYCLSFVPVLARQAFGRPDLDISFVLESGHQNAGDADRIFHKVKNSRNANPAEREIVGMFRTITFRDKKKFPGLQVADINAYSGYQHELKPDRLQVVELNPDKPTMQAAKKYRQTPVFRFELKENGLRVFKQFILDEIEEKKQRRRRVA